MVDWAHITLGFLVLSTVISSLVMQICLLRLVRDLSETVRQITATTER